MTYRAIEMIATFYDYKMDALISFPILFTKLDCNLFFHATQPLVVSKVGEGGGRGSIGGGGGSRLSKFKTLQVSPDGPTRDRLDYTPELPGTA